ncbi:hypothetical protein [Thiomicrorhabdus sp. 6S3-12]|uniref:hypothetical protein n=1 Tax=Thiomicrorhabdus sp. 6S3-12 TaxID=2819681 RepID=UPI001AAD7163|nr:hypothetical protein [Thiomicrorhabdus sp. 6S3-12]MBO1924722.1 hypothetical protein [Thiomicrorhabdus sp. 6S3-12]
MELSETLRQLKAVIDQQKKLENGRCNISHFDCDSDLGKIAVYFTDKNNKPLLAPRRINISCSSADNIDMIYEKFKNKYPELFL